MAAATSFMASVIFWVFLTESIRPRSSRRPHWIGPAERDPGELGLWEGTWNGLTELRKERAEALEREGFEDTNVVRFVQDIVNLQLRKTRKEQTREEERGFFL